jgi:hypothetical protein
VPPWTRTAVQGWPDARRLLLVECERHHTVFVTAGDVRRAA